MKIELFFSISLVGVGIYLFWCLILLTFGEGKDEVTSLPPKMKIDQLVILVPALNEASVIEQTINNFLRSTEKLPQVKMYIIDDASSDATAQLAQALLKRHQTTKVQILQRKLPEAQTGKGEALNWAYQKIKANAGTKNIVCGVLDADAYLSEASYRRIIAIFENDPELALVQTRVGMFAEQNWLQKLQDIEFIVINNWIQNIRNRLKNAAASGNGQFIRLNASPETRPWGNALLEDFEFSTRFLLQGKKTYYAGEVIVYQEALAKIIPFIRQRARWCQGGLDCLFKYWSKILRSRTLRFGAKLEMTFYLFLPFISIVTGLANILVFFFIIAFFARYWLLAVILLLINTWINVRIMERYNKVTGQITFFNALWLLLIMLVYNYLFYFAILLAFYNKFRKKTHWVKTSHVGSDSQTLEE